MNARRTTGHLQYRDGLLEKLRILVISRPGITISEARAELRRRLDEADVDLLFDNWLNAHFDRIRVTQIGAHSVTAEVIPFRESRKIDRAAAAEERRKRDLAAVRLARDTKENLYQEFAGRIWETVLPNGVRLRDARGRDLKHAGGWFSTLAAKINANESVFRKFSTKVLFNIAQREM